MADVGKINQEVGARIIEYDKKDQEVPLIFRSSMQTPKIQKKASYHWEEERKELDSPAKILNNALKMTFDLTKLLNITE